MAGRNAREWALQNDEVCVHAIRNSRARAVAREATAGHEGAGVRSPRPRFQAVTPSARRQWKRVPAGAKTDRLVRCVLFLEGSGLKPTSCAQ